MEIITRKCRLILAQIMSFKQVLRLLSKHINHTTGAFASAAPHPPWETRSPTCCTPSIRIKLRLPHRRSCIEMYVSSANNSKINRILCTRHLWYHFVYCKLIFIFSFLLSLKERTAIFMLIYLSSVGFNLDLIRSITSRQPSDRIQAFCWS